MKKAIILALLFIPSVQYGQFPGPGGSGNVHSIPSSVPSPNAASLGIYGQIPVNYFNGLPNIGIPIFSGADIDISLSYHATGIRPEEHPGWVGLGWNLNVGGAITRVVKGGVDEVLVSSFTDKATFSYYSYPGVLDRANWYGGVNMEEYYLNTHPIHAGGASYIPHPSPDEFSFNFNGLSGSFYYNHKGKWVVKSSQPIQLKIEEELGSYNLINETLCNGDVLTSNNINIKRIFTGFTITDQNGTKYTFGKAPGSIEFSSTYKKFDSYNNHYIATTWYLTKITKPNKREIEFEYVRDKSPVFKQSVGTTINYWEHKSQAAHEQKPKIYSVQRYFLAYLKKIISQDIEIIFTRSLSNELKFDFRNELNAWLNSEGEGAGGAIQKITNDSNPCYEDQNHWYKLDRIEIKNSNGAQIKLINFEYKDQSDSRLFLTAMKEGKFLSAVSENILVNLNPKVHSFYYNEFPLPPYNSQKVDHWGYYNGVNYFDGIPSDHHYSGIDEVEEYFNSRKPNSALMKAGILTKIVYPTNGFSEFVYEPHEYSSVVVKKNPISGSYGVDPVSNAIAGGLRIKEISSNPSNKSGEIVTKEYFYVKDYKNGNNTSSGILAGYPKYLEKGPIFGGALDYWFWNSYPIEPMSHTSGSHITYTKVVEKIKDGGFTEYSFSNHDEQKYRDFLPYAKFTSNSEQWKYLPFNSNSLLRGKLLNEKYYDSNNALLKHNKYFYKSILDSPENSIRSLYVSSRVLGQPISKGAFTDLSGVAYNHVLSAIEIPKYFHFLERKEEHNYLSYYNVLTTSSLYTYNYDRLLIQEIKVQSDGVELETKYKYPQDYTSPSSVLTDMIQNKHMIAVPVEQITKLNGKIIGAIGTKFHLENNMILPKAVYGLETNFPLKSFSESTDGENFNSYEKNVIYHKYDNKGNILEYSKTNDIHTSIIWGYNKTYPVARVVNATYTQIESALGANFVVSKGLSATQETALRNIDKALVTTYTYKPLVGILTETDQNGRITTYEYDNFNRLKLIKDNEENIVNKFDYHYTDQ